MACERYREELADVAAGAPPRPDLEAHLSSCGACRAELDGLRRALTLADAALGGLASAEPSPALRARILRAVADDEGAARSSAVWRFGWAAALTAGVLVAAFLAATWRSGSRAPGTLSREATMEETPRGPEPGGAPERPSGPAVASRETPPAAVPGRRAEAPSGAVRLSPRSAVRVAPEPEVLVPPGGAEALFRFAAHLQRRRVPPDSLLVADLSGPLPELRPVEVKPPLEIVPLDPAEGSGT
jgi:hypothetical protein